MASITRLNWSTLRSVSTCTFLIDVCRLVAVRRRLVDRIRQRVGELQQRAPPALVDSCIHAECRDSRSARRGSADALQPGGEQHRHGQQHERRRRRSRRTMFLIAPLPQRCRIDDRREHVRIGGRDAVLDAPRDTNCRRPCRSAGCRCRRSAGQSTANHQAQRWIDSIVALKPIVQRQNSAARSAAVPRSRICSTSRSPP